MLRGVATDRAAVLRVLARLAGLAVLSDCTVLLLTTYCGSTYYGSAYYERAAVLRVLSNEVEAGDVQAELLTLRELAEGGAETDELLPRHPRRQFRLRSRRCDGAEAAPHACSTGLLHAVLGQGIRVCTGEERTCSSLT